MGNDRKSSLWILLSLATVAGICLGGTVAWLSVQLTQPLGPSLDLPTQALVSNLPIATSPSPALDTPGPTATNLPTSTPWLPTATPNIPKTKCGGPPVMTILAIGSDTRAYNYLYGLADVIRIVRVDFVTPRVTILEFPRDLWVEIPGISAHYGITHGKLNQAYLYGNPGMGYYEGPGEGPGLLARTLEQNFGVHADNYVAVNMHTFVKLVDAVGGIDVKLPVAVDGRAPDQATRSDLYFGAGPHHLDGTQALMLSRIRKNTVFERVSNQNIVMCALRKELLSPAIVTKIPAIIQSFKGSAQTDLSATQIGQLACLAPQIDPADIAFVSFPTDLLTGTRTYDIGVQKDVFIWDADFTILRSYVLQFNQGSWPSAQSEPSASPSLPSPDYTCP
jgi:LCP family protein required for cell wall assembly